LTTLADGTEFNFDFWTKCQPRRDTYKACRAVIAASQQNAEEAMIEAIQKAYYLRAMNPSEHDSRRTLIMHDYQDYRASLRQIQSCLKTNMVTIRCISTTS
jgi:protein-disulfide isomerase-like protein with CxxC motif